MSAKIYGGVDIAMKIPAHQMAATVAFYRDTVGLKPIEAKAPAIGFELGPNKLWLDEDPKLSQAEVWLELFTDDHRRALSHLEERGAVRCDAVEPLGAEFRGGWIMNPANIVHMVREEDAW